MTGTIHSARRRFPFRLPLNTEIYNEVLVRLSTTRRTRFRSRSWGPPLLQ